MRRAAVLLALALAFPAPAQGWAKASQGWGKISSGAVGSYATTPPPTGCASGLVPYFNASLQLVCSPTVYAPATDTTTATGTVAARNLTATALATPGITPPVSNVLSLLTTVTVVAGASLVDGDYFTLSDGSAVVYEFDNDATVTPGRVGITFVGTETAQEIRDLVVIAINGSTLGATAIAAAADTLTVTSDTAGDTMGVNSENVTDAGFLVPVWGEPTHATTYGYKVEACLADGTCAPSAEVQTTTGHATLNGANYNSVTWGAVTGASYYKLTRVTGTPSGGDAPPRLLYTGPLLNFADTNATSTSKVPATTNTTGRVLAEQLLVGGGSSARPSIAFTDGEGMHVAAPGRVAFSASGDGKVFLGGYGVGGYGLALGADTPITRADAKTVQIGNGPSATPNANTLIVGESGAGTDIAGANGVVQSGAGTGSGTGSTLTLKTPAAHGSDDVAQTQTTRMVLGPTGVNIPGLATYADNAAATTGGLVAGDLYRTSTGVLMVTY